MTDLDGPVPIAMSYGFAKQGCEGLTVDRVWQRDGADRWAVRDGGVCITREIESEYEPLPSSRTDEFLARCRFDTFEEALAIAHAWIRKHYTENRDQ